MSELIAAGMLLTAGAASTLASATDWVDVHGDAARRLRSMVARRDHLWRCSPCQALRRLAADLPTRARAAPPRPSARRP
jgi:hypothetical protein